MNGYPANVREYARRLAEANGWSPYRIRKALMGRISPVPSEWAIRCWIDPEYGEDRNRRRRRFGRPGKGRRPRRFERIRELHEAGLSCPAVARVMNLDFGLSLTDGQVRTLLDGATPRTQRKHLYPEPRYDE